MSSAWTPNLIMPGVAKCGSTTLHDILVSHPEITGGNEKEVRFLMDADETQPRQTDIHKSGPDGWRKLYPAIDGPQPKYWLDATPQYQYQHTAKTIIADMKPAPKILFIVRRPSARLYSMYQYAKYHQRTIDFIPDFPSFIEAISENVDVRLNSQTMLSNAWQNTDYKQMYLEWRKLVGEENILLISLEKLIDDRISLLERLSGFLDIDRHGFVIPSSAQSNPTVSTKSRMVRKLGAKVAKHLPENHATRWSKNLVKRLNSGGVDASEKHLNSELLAKIDGAFSEAWEYVQTVERS